MSQYKRMVSYLYKYINGAKSQNTGFVRIELMDKQCRFTVQMRMIPFEVYPKVYLYIQKERGAKCIEVSDMGVKSGNLVSRFMLNRENIEQTGYSFDDIDGLIVYIGKEMFFATSWVKDEVKLGEMEIFSPTGKKENIFKTDKLREDAFNSEKIEKDSNKENGTVSLSGETAENNNVEVHNGNVADINDSAGSVNGAFETEKFKSDNNESAESVDFVQDVSKKESDEEFDPEKVIIKASVYDEGEKDFGERILSTFPIMYPFVSGIIEKSVRIELKDIGCLPIKMWVLANNAFLLHGYCSYRHIIFAKINTDEKEVQYAIGSPGIYNEYDEKIARQHGFIYFQPIGDVKNVCGAFGYWIHPLK